MSSIYVSGFLILITLCWLGTIDAKELNVAMRYGFLSRALWVWSLHVSFTTDTFCHDRALGFEMTDEVT